MGSHRKGASKAYVDSHLAGKALAVPGAPTNNYFWGWNDSAQLYELLSVLGAGGAPNGAAGGGLRGSYPDPLAGGTRILRVDPTAGAGDFTTIADAATYVNGQTCDTSHRWVILLPSGLLVESGTPPSFPAYVWLASRAPFGASLVGAGAPTTVLYSHTSGNGITFNANGGAYGIEFIRGAGTTLSGDSNLVRLVGGAALSMCGVWDLSNKANFNLTGILITSGTTRIDGNTYVVIGGSNVTNAVSVRVQGSALLSMFNAWIDSGPPVGIQHEGTAMMILRQVVIGGVFNNAAEPLTADLKTTSTGKIFVHEGCYYRTKSEATPGTIIDVAGARAHYLQNVAPVDADIPNGSSVRWLDETNHTIVERTRDNSGNLHTVTSAAWT